ncbi:hypothetical protein OU997_09885 [Pseudomonas sp. SL4(2022)]|uniref:hypothetical protein n=1 Tax=Pseudomonas sp. SL4(2022) TaxID=2994661 RepID=UPI00227083CC|nr:hypothetical protein [Pseudomonas sp. SL4(2022)]WAC46441.1 hypothetical protein OU997_09885 [Pseudomonas sp. SL4(2022)]
MDLNAGQYTGSYELSVGEQGNEDIYVGKHKQISSENRTITFNLNFTVTHILKVQTIGSTTVYMQPKIGWEAWLASDKIQKRRNASEGRGGFIISVSGPFSVTVRCQYPTISGECKLRSTDKTRVVFIDAFLHLPAAYQGGSQWLTNPFSTPLSFTPERPLFAAPGHIEFVTQAHSLDLPNNYDDGYLHFSGDVTIIFESHL